MTVALQRPIVLPSDVFSRPMTTEPSSNGAKGFWQIVSMSR